MKASGSLESLWRNVPLVCALLGVSSLLHLECRTLEPPAWELAYTALFPLGWLGWGVWRTSSLGGVGRRASIRGVLLACVVLPLAVVQIPGIEFARPLDALKLCHEVTGFVWFAVVALHCLHQRGGWGGALFFVAGAVYGVALENGGIQMGFFSEEGYRIYLRPLLPGPLVTAFGWCTVFYTVTFVTERITTAETPAWKRTALAVGMALCMDLQIDPAATLVGWWVWHPSLEPAHHGVPLINYISWACAVTPFAWHYFSMTSRHYDNRKRAIRTLIGIPVYLAVGSVLVISATFILCGPSSSAMRLFLGVLGSV